MGWRYQDYLDRKQREADREFAASLSPGERLRLRIWQAAGIGIVVCIVALFVLFAIEARSAPIEPGAVKVIDGDTIRTHGDIYRLVGLETPESGLNARCE